MGIDKSNVNFVIHYNMPKSLEAYYQEAGRGRTRRRGADCILLYSAGDVETAKFLIQSGGEELGDAEREELRRRDYERLKIMTGYCKTTRCLRGYILDYFGQPHAEECGNCGNCRRTYRLEDITISAQMILSCVVRVRETLGYYVGKTLIVQTLRGSRDRRLLQARAGQAVQRMAWCGSSPRKRCSPCWIAWKKRGICARTRSISRWNRPRPPTACCSAGEKVAHAGTP